jgi:LTXXQ motif family protein
VKKNLWKAALAGVIALAAVGPASATKFRPTSHVGSVLTDGQIHRMKAALRLTRVQEQYWPPIEAALREMARELSRKSASQEGSAAAIDEAKVQRLASVAYPLLATLDDGQKRNAMALARAMGLGSLVASF